MLHYLVQYVWKVLYKTIFYFVDENILPENWTTILKRQKQQGLKVPKSHHQSLKKLNLTATDYVEYASGQTFLQSIGIESHELCTDYDECVRKTTMASALPIVIGEDILYSYRRIAGHFLLSDSVTRHLISSCSILNKFCYYLSLYIPTQSVLPGQ